VDHELVRTGPYRLLRHPIYTAMLGMFLGTAIASSQFHALLGLAILVVAYLRKTRLEDQILPRLLALTIMLTAATRGRCCLCCSNRSAPNGPIPGGLRATLK